MTSCVSTARCNIVAVESGINGDKSKRNISSTAVIIVMIKPVAAVTDAANVVRCCSCH